MENFFYEKDEVIRESLLTTKALDWAREFIRTRPSLSSAQLRRFYHDAKALEARVEAEGFEKIRPLIKMIKSKAAYSCGTRKIPVEFKSFMDTCIDRIDQKEDFDGFMLVFEAVVGYFYGEGGGKR